WRVAARSRARARAGPAVHDLSLVQNGAGGCGVGNRDGAAAVEGGAAAGAAPRRGTAVYRTRDAADRATGGELDPDRDEHGVAGPGGRLPIPVSGVAAALLRAEHGGAGVGAIPAAVGRAVRDHRRGDDRDHGWGTPTAGVADG